MYIEQAFKVKHDFWRYIVGAIMAVFGYVLFQFPLAVAMLLEAGDDFKSLTEHEMMGVLDSNVTLVLMILSFAGVLIALFFAVRFLHEQSLRSLTTSRPKIDLKRIFFSFSLWALFVVGITLFEYYMAPEDYVLNFKPVPFFILLAIVLLLLPLQTSAEEYLFRGYLMQGIGTLARNRWVPLFITSVLFGLLHFSNPEIDKLGESFIVVYITIGFFLGIITLMDGGLELALGVHAANNMISALLVTADWTAFQTDSILKDISDPVFTWSDYLIYLGGLGIVLWVLAKKYKWNDWRERLSGKVLPPADNHNMETTGEDI